MFGRKVLEKSIVCENTAKKGGKLLGKEEQVFEVESIFHSDRKV